MNPKNDYDLISIKGLKETVLVTTVESMKVERKKKSIKYIIFFEIIFDLECFMYFFNEGKRP